MAWMQLDFAGTWAGEGCPGCLIVFNQEVLLGFAIYLFNAFYL